GSGRRRGGKAFDRVYQRLDGLQEEERRARLAKLAQKEGALSVYTSNTSMPVVVRAFEKEFGIQSQVYRAQSETVSQRALSEAKSGQVKSDIIDNTAEFMQIAHQEGLLGEYQGPARDGLPELALGPGFTANQHTVFAVAWNSKLVPADRRPSSYQDLTDPWWADKLLIDPRHDAMYYALHRHFRSKGLSAQEFRGMFRKLGENAVPMEGGTPRANAVVSGEHSGSLGSFIHEVDEQAKKDAPITWQPAVEPLYSEPVGSGLAAGAPHPAAALLFYEWILAEGQKELAALSRVTSAEFGEGGRLAKRTVLTIDYGQYVKERDKWQSEFHQLIGYR
ncbi:MAG: ABC transporter substrate-binding protein, partial [Micromonosporaceae bacterium]